MNALNYLSSLVLLCMLNPLSLPHYPYLNAAVTKHKVLTIRQIILKSIPKTSN